MIEYNEKFYFVNDVAEFTINAHTEEHPSGYGNGTILVFDIETDYPCQRRQIFDVRYDGSDMASLARLAIKQHYGVNIEEEEA